MADITSRLRVLAKNIIAPASALLLVVGLAGCGSTSAAPAPATSDSSSSASNDGSASDSSTVPSESATPDATEATSGSDIDQFVKALHDAGFTNVVQDSTGVVARFGPNDQYGFELGPNPKGGGLWYQQTTGGNDGVSPETISQVENAWLSPEENGNLWGSGIPASSILKIINHIQLENGVIQQR